MAKFHHPAGGIRPRTRPAGLPQPPRVPLKEWRDLNRDLWPHEELNIYSDWIGPSEFERLMLTVVKWTSLLSRDHNGWKSDTRFGGKQRVPGWHNTPTGSHVGGPQLQEKTDTWHHLSASRCYASLWKSVASPAEPFLTSSPVLLALNTRHTTVAAMSGIESPLWAHLTGLNLSIWWC